MKFISKRISVSETKESVSIVISPDTEPLKQTLLFSWIVFWTVAGVIVLTQIFAEYSNDQQLFMFIWLLFWAYFEYITVYAWFWKKYGFERLSIHSGKLYYKRSIKNKGKTKIINQEIIKNVKITEEPENSLMSNLNKSYWMVAGERIIVDYNSNNVKLGIKLTNVEALSVVKLLNRYLKKN